MTGSLSNDQVMEAAGKLRLSLKNFNYPSPVKQDTNTSMNAFNKLAKMFKRAIHQQRITR